MWGFTSRIVQLRLLSQLESNPLRKFSIPLRIDLGDVRALVTEDNLSSFNTCTSAHIRTTRVTELMRGPRGDACTLTRPLDGPTVAICGVSRPRRTGWHTLLVGSWAIPAAQRRPTLRMRLGPTSRFGLQWAKARAVIGPQEIRLEDRLRPRPEVNLARMAAMSGLMGLWTVEPYFARSVHVTRAQ